MIENHKPQLDPFWKKSGHHDLSKKLDDGLIKKFLFLERFVEDISSIGTIEAYLKKRPKLIDVSIKPQLLINGVPHPTGVNQT